MQLLIHIGSAKAASTWLQSRVFRNAALGFEEIGTRKTQKGFLTAPDAATFDQTAAKSHFDPLAQRAIAKGLCPVVSVERLSGTSRLGHQDALEFANRLKAVFAEGRIFFVVREQRSMLRAQYLQYIRRGGTGSIHWFLDQHAQRTEAARYFWWDRFDYAALWERYQQFFGAQNTLLLPLELLAESPPAFVGQLCDFAGLPAPSIDRMLLAAPIRKSAPSLSYAVQRRLSRFLGHQGRAAKDRAARGRVMLDRLTPNAWQDLHKDRLDAAIRERVGDFFGASNRKLQSMSGLDLEPFGYDL